ncbi:hypothetical protein [Nonomuraea sp. NPDC003214]
MNLNITPALITELYEYGQQTGRPADTVIILTPQGWDTKVLVNGTGPAYDDDPTLWPITAQGIYDWLDGEEIDDDCAEALASPGEPGRDDYSIPNEHGDHDATPHPSWNVQVVTGATDKYGDVVHDWRDAFWFNVDDATQITETDSGHSLWRTAGGRWLRLHGDQWTELQREDAAEWAYNTAPNDLLGDVDEQDPLVKAAQAARLLASAFAAPEVPTASTGYFNNVDRRPGDVRDEAADTFHAIPAITEHLMKQVVLPSLRGIRAQAAQIVVDSFNGNQSAAARHLGVNQSTLNKMLPEPPPPAPADDHTDDYLT